MRPRDTVRTPSGLLIPRGGIIRARERRRPGPRMHGAMGGHLHWQLVDREGGIAQEGEQSNLILNQGLDNMTTRTIYRTGSSSTFAWLSYVAVGTGSTAPDATDTALVSELARTVGSYQSNAASRPTQGTYTLKTFREFDFGVANGNLTEWGMSGAASGELNTRELFRDELGDPVVVTKTSDFKLRMAYTLTVYLTPYFSAPQAYMLPITGVGDVNGDYMWIGGEAYALNVFSKCLIGAATRLRLYGTTVTDSFNSGNQSSAGWTGMTVDAYVGGSYTRTWQTVTIPTSVSNHASVRGIHYGQTGTGGSTGFIFQIDLADAFTKDNEHILTLTDPLTVTWGRTGS